MPDHPDPPAAGDPWSQALIEQNRRWLHAWFVAVTGDRHAAEDLTQEVFVVALRARQRFDPQRSFGAWLRGIARKLLLRHFRERRQDLLTCDPAILDLLDRQAEQVEARYDGDPERERSLLRECLHGLGERARRLLDERYRRGRTSRAIGQVLHMSVGAVDMALHRARRALARCLEQRLMERR